MTTSRPRVLYCSVTGALQPLGYSQVVRPLLALSKLGARYDLVTLEREEDLADEAHVARLNETLAEAGVRWHHSVYRTGGGPKKIASNMGRFFAMTLRVARQSECQLVHARAYLGGAVALALQALMGTPYLFDTRSFWIDELQEEGRRFIDPLSDRAGHAFERLLFERCAGAVCLAEPGARDIAAGLHGRWDANKPLRVIPTCVDYESFTPSADAALPEAARLDGRLVIAHIGSLNASYKIAESIELFARVRERREDALLLGLTRQQDALREALVARGITPDDFLITSAQHYEMPAWLQRIDWGLLLLKTSRSKRASMPTKLAELFASGVRPIQHGCNDSVSDWVRLSGSGVVLDSLAEDALDKAAQVIATSPRRDHPDVIAATTLARARTREHFSIEAGARAYRDMIDEILG